MQKAGFLTTRLKYEQLQTNTYVNEQAFFMYGLNLNSSISSLDYLIILKAQMIDSKNMLVGQISQELLQTKRYINIHKYYFAPLFCYNVDNLTVISSSDKKRIKQISMEIRFTA